MAISDVILQLSRGTIFTAPAETALPAAGLNGFTIDADELDPWTNLGDLSDDNKVSFSIDGGDPTTLATWRRSNARTTYGTKTLTMTGNSVQLDADTLKFIYNGWDSGNGGVAVALDTPEQKLAIFVLGYDPGVNKDFGIYIPNMSFNWAGLPDLTGDNFAEVSFTASAQNSNTLPKRNGKQATFAFYPPEAFAPKA